MTESTTAERIQRLLSPERRRRLDVSRILSLLALRPYLSVADIGCGPGLFTIPLAKSLWDGKVYAVDVEEEMLEAVRQRAKTALLGNVVTVKGNGDSVPLDPGSLDGALLACVLHETQDHGAFLKSVAASLKRGGWCAIIEWRKTTEGTEGPPQEQRIAEDDVVHMASDVGMHLSTRRELNSHHYLLVFTK